MPAVTATRAVIESGRPATSRVPAIGPNGSSLARDPLLALPGPVSLDRALYLQRTAGNAAVGWLVARSVDSPTVQRKLRPWMQEQVSHVIAGMGEGAWDAPQGPWWWLNGYGTQDLIDILNALGAERRRALIAHLADADGYDRPRLEVFDRIGGLSSAPAWPAPP